MNQKKNQLEVYFENFSKIHSKHEFWLNASNDREPLVNVLTIHLMSENFLEAYICYRLNISDLFDEKIISKDEKIFFKLQYNQKLKFARRLGLPREAYEFFDKLNQLRNKFAHDLNASPINKSLIESLINIVNRMEPVSDLFEQEHQGVRTFKKNGEVDKTYKFNDEKTTNSIRLSILYAFIIRKLNFKICNIKI